MNPNRFFFPGYMGNTNNIMHITPMMRATNNFLSSPISRVANANGIFHNTSFFSKLTNGIRSVNWGGLLNNANKTLNVVNQTIPLVRQAGPMVNNMKNMVKIAKVFGSETSINRKNNRQLTNNIVDNNIINNNVVKIEKTNIDNDNFSLSDNYISDSIEPTIKKESQNISSPSFFIY